VPLKKISCKVFKCSWVSILSVDLSQKHQSNFDAQCYIFYVNMKNHFDTQYCAFEFGVNEKAYSIPVVLEMFF